MPWGMVVTSEAIHPKSTQMGAFLFLLYHYSHFSASGSWLIIYMTRICCMQSLQNRQKVDFNNLLSADSRNHLLLHLAFIIYGRYQRIS